MSPKTKARKEDVIVQVDYNLPEKVNDVELVVAGSDNQQNLSSGRKELLKSGIQHFIRNEPYTATVKVEHPPEYQRVDLLSPQTVTRRDKYSNDQHSNHIESNDATTDKFYETVVFDVEVPAGLEGKGGTVRLLREKANSQLQVGVKFPPLSVFVLQKILGENPSPSELRKAYDIVFGEWNTNMTRHMRVLDYYSLTSSEDEYMAFRQALASVVDASRSWHPTPEEYITAQCFSLGEFTSTDLSPENVWSLVDKWNGHQILPATDKKTIIRKIIGDMVSKNYVSTEHLRKELFNALKSQSQLNCDTWHDVFYPDVNALGMFISVLYASGHREDALTIMDKMPMYVDKDNLQQQIKRASRASKEDKLSEWAVLLPVVNDQSPNQLEYVIGKVLYSGAANYAHKYQLYKYAIAISDLAGDFLQNVGLDKFGTNAYARARYFEANGLLKGDKREKAIEAYQSAMEHAIFTAPDRTEYYVASRSLEYFTTAVITAAREEEMPIEEVINCVESIQGKLSEVRDELPENVCGPDTSEYQYFEAGQSELVAHKLLITYSENEDIPTIEQVVEQFKDAIAKYNNCGKETQAEGLYEYLTNVLDKEQLTNYGVTQMMAGKQKHAVSTTQP